MKHKIKVKRVKGRVAVLKVLPYKGCNIYIRQYDKEIFTYDIVYEGQIYFQYVVMKPAKGKVKLNADEVEQTIGILWAGATATVDTLMGVTLDDKTKEIAQTVLDAQKKAKKQKKVPAQVIN